MKGATALVVRVRRHDRPEKAPQTAVAVGRHN